MAAGRHHAGATPSSRLRGAAGATGFGSERDGQNRIRENSVRDSAQARDQHLTKNRDRDMDRHLGNGDRRDKDRNGSSTYGDAVQRPGISGSIAKAMPPESDLTMAKGGAELNREPGELGSDEGLLTERPKKRKYSPIVWDLDDKKVQSRSSSVQRQVNAVTPPQTIPNRASLSPPPAVLLSRPSELHSSPPRKAPESIIDLLNRAESPDAPEPGQLAAVSPRREEGEDEEMPAPPTSIAGSRWAEETSPEAEKSPSGKGGSTGADSADEGPSMEPEGSLHGSGSPEPGEYIMDDWLKRREGANSNVGADQSSGGNSDDKPEAQYEEELNKKELMELDEEVDEDDSHDREPEEDSDDEDEPPTPPPQQQRYIDMLKGCRSVDEFERLNKIDEGTYGVVYRARDKKTGEIVALKKVKMDNEREGFPMTSLREINVLLSFHHPAIVDVKEVVVGSSLDSIFMVMEYMEHDLKGLMEAMKQPFSQSEAKCLMLQLFEGVQYLHENWVLHRDLKTSNLLLNNRGDLKICDFGLARQYGSPLKTYTRMVVTLWYRAPELLLGSKKYSTAIDMWSLGCIMAEFLAKEPLFSGKSEIDQLDKIFKTLGTPNEKIWPDFVHLPGVKCNFVRQPYNRLREKFPPIAFGGRPALSERGYDLLNRLLTYDPEKRITAEEALNHEWFREVPLPKMKELMPTFPVRSEQDRRLRRLMKSPDPLEEQRKRELRQAEFGAGGIFG